jgi:hypothetical protein
MLRGRGLGLEKTTERKIREGVGCCLEAAPKFRKAGPKISGKPSGFRKGGRKFRSAIRGGSQASFQVIFLSREAVVNKRPIPKKQQKSLRP